MDLYKIAKIKDSDFGFNTPIGFTFKRREDVHNNHDWNSGCFSNKRDLEIARYFKSTKG